METKYNFTIHDKAGQPPISDRLFIGKQIRGQETVLGYLGIGNMNDHQARGVVWIVIDGEGLKLHLRFASPVWRV